MRLVTVAGPHGVGKSSMLREMVSAHFAREVEAGDITLVNRGAVFREIAVRRFGGEYEGSYQRLDHARRAEVVAEATSTIARMDKPLVILDGHMVEVDTGPMRPIWDRPLERMIDTHIVVWANPKAIMGRRLGDTSRVLAPDEKEIAREIAGELEMGRGIARRTGAHVREIDLTHTDSKTAACILYNEVRNVMALKR